MNPSELFIRRPVATTLLTVAIAIAGAIAFVVLPVSPLPQVDFPTISVSAQLPGASAQIMASSVATPLERQFGHIAGVSEMTSASSLGSTSITIQFDLSRNIDGAARDVEAAISAARTYLPANLPANPTYRKVNPADAPIMILGLTSKKYDTGKLYDEASTVMEQKLSQIQGVGQVVVGGASLPSVRVDVNPAQLNSYGLTLSNIQSILSTQNADIAKGQISDGSTTADIIANDQISKAEDYKPIVIGYHNGTAVRLSDVAQITDSVQNIRSAGYLNGIPSVTVIIFRQPGANIIQTVDNIRGQLPFLKASIPQGIDATIVLDRTTTIRASVSDVERTLMISVALVILVVFIFLRNARATLIPSVAVPVSLIGTFAVMYLVGYSLDNLSLMALTISTGFVVDDAIVVMENISRHLELGMKPFEAALKGAQEIGFTVFSISVSLIAVFIPILMMGGIVGRLFREFAITLSTAIVVSMVISLTTTPMMCAYLLKEEKKESRGRMYQLSEKFFAWMLETYRRSLVWVLDHSALTLGVLLLTIVLNGVLIYRIPKGFFPQQDTGAIVGGVQGPQDSSFPAMDNSIRQLVGVIKSDPAVANVNAYTGGNGSTNTGFIYIALKPLDERKISATEVIRRMQPRLEAVEGIQLFLQPLQDLTVEDRVSRTEFQYSLEDPDQVELARYTRLMVDELRKENMVTDVASDLQDQGLGASLVIDRDTAARLGIAMSDVDNTLYDAFGQRQVSTIFTQLNQYHVVMEVGQDFQTDPATLNNLYVKSGNGAQVPLSMLAHWEQSRAQLSIGHQGQFPSTVISFNLAPGKALGDAVNAVNRIERVIQMPAAINASFQGTAAAFQTSLANEPILILAALVTVYIVLGVLYESYIHPITIISSLPSAGVGALLALLITRTEFSVIALIGIILLIGIVQKNAIMMIDFALQAQRIEGKPAEEAIFQACLLRFRPIIMTTLAAMLGGLPLALGGGVGAELRRPLGITIVGGLIFSQLLTLYTVPVVYLYFDKLARRMSRRGIRASHEQQAVTAD